MAIYYVKDQSITDIADAIRTKRQEEDQYTLQEMPEKILGISGGSSVKIKTQVGHAVLVSSPTVIINTLTE